MDVRRSYIGSFIVLRYDWLQHFHYCLQIQQLDQTGTKNLRSFRHSVATHCLYSPRVMRHFCLVAGMNFVLTDVWNFHCVVLQTGNDVLTRLVAAAQTQH